MKHIAFFFTATVAVSALVLPLPASSLGIGVSGNTAPSSTATNESGLQRGVARSESSDVLPFGSKLFTGSLGGDARKDSANPFYRINPGDEVTVSLWGTANFSETLKVDDSGNIFLPEIGPIHVANVAYRRLNEVIKARVSSIYTDGIGVYADIAGTQPISVFVTGEATHPGRYGGAASDSILHFLDRAGGPDKNQGSYRMIEVRRDNYRIAKVDLYAFLLDGRLPDIILEDGDTIFVHERGDAVSAFGEVYKNRRFEFNEDDVEGLLLEELARPRVGATHVSISGIRRGEPFKSYISRTEFASFGIRDGDSVFFHNAMDENSIRVFAEGTFSGPKALIVPPGTGLIDILHNLKVETGRTDVRGISLERISVQQRQKKALEDSLTRLEQSVMYAPVTSGEDAAIRKQEADAVTRFIENARNVEPGGRIVISEEGLISDITLEDGDKIYIPEISNIVYVSGEAVMPQAIVEKNNADLMYYIDRAGGFSRRADKKRVLVRKANGAVVKAKQATITGGDEIIILPEVYMNKLQFARDMTDILYKVAIAAAVPLNFLDD